MWAGFGAVSEVTRRSPMASLRLTNIRPALHERLRARAAAHGRSPSAEALAILEEAPEDRAELPTMADIDALRVRGRAPLTQALIDAARRGGRR
ncbi:MAG: hypothetical protein KC583_05315 [Myxococcales bacterium]|nr:hypothetical protein [Myxococcales bacterium]